MWDDTRKAKDDISKEHFLSGLIASNTCTKGIFGIIVILNRKRKISEGSIDSKKKRDIHVKKRSDSSILYGLFLLMIFIGIW